MASVTKRKWTYNGVEKTAWMVRYVDRTGARRFLAAAFTRTEGTFSPLQALGTGGLT